MIQTPMPAELTTLQSPLIGVFQFQEMEKLFMLINILGLRAKRPKSFFHVSINNAHDSFFFIYFHPNGRSIY
jgi:hypothetical protein